MALTQSFLSLLALISLVPAYTWPNPHVDFIEDFYTVNSVIPGQEVSPCGTTGIVVIPRPTTGRQIAAEWVRT
jgi:hypothetical protein